MVMDATSISILTNPYVISYPNSLFIRVSVCRLLPLASWKKPLVQPKKASSNASTTGPSSRWKNVMGRAYKEDAFSSHTSFEDKSSNRGKLIELFKRIQIEISEGESGSEDDSKTFDTFSDNDSSVETSVLEFLRQSSRKSKGNISNLKHNSAEPSHKRTARKDKPMPTPQPLSTTNFSRPPSNFVKKSPIPSPTPLRNHDIVVNYREDSNSADGEESSKIEEMKLIELKELARKRGLKGYSKLKKRELVQLLKS